MREFAREWSLNMAAHRGDQERARARMEWAGHTTAIQQNEAQELLLGVLPRNQVV